jgi:hypothetical protein
MYQERAWTRRDHTLFLALFLLMMQFISTRHRPSPECDRRAFAPHPMVRRSRLISPSLGFS